jgi:citrate synthase
VNVKIELPFILNPADESLLSLFMQAHAETANANANASSYACRNASLVTGRLENGLASAIMSLGGHHAPLTEARHVYKNWVKADVDFAMNNKVFIPGFGNSFFKGSVDPSWQVVDSYLYTWYPEQYARISQLKEWIAQNNRTLYPNAAMYSAVVCEILNVAPGTEVALLILARLPVWTMEYACQNDSHRLFRV